MLAAQILSVAALCATAVVAKPVPAEGQTQSRAVKDILLKVAPQSESCDPDGAFPEECATNVEAAPYVRAAMQQYGVYHPNEIAGLLSLMAFETGDFKFNRNHFPEPGRPGQGTRNLQMIEFNLLYALSIPELHDEALAIARQDENGTMSGGPVIEPEDIDAEELSDDQKNDILELILPDEYAWGSAAWFYTTQCDPSVRQALAAGTEEGLSTYLVDCVGTTLTDERVEYWERAREAFGFSS